MIKCTKTNFAIFNVIWSYYFCLWDIFYGGPLETHKGAKNSFNSPLWKKCGLTHIFSKKEKKTKELPPVSPEPKVLISKLDVLELKKTIPKTYLMASKESSKDDV